MADNKKEIHDLDDLIKRILDLQKTLDHMNSTKSIQRWGKSIQDSLKDATGNLSQVTTWTKILKKERDELLSVLAKQPADIQNQFGGLIKTLGGLPQTMQKIASQSSQPFSRSFKQVFGQIQYLFLTQLRWYTAKALTLNVLSIPPAALESIKEYNQGLTDIAAISRASQVDINELGKTIVNVATTTKYSVGDIAQAGTLLAQAGLSIEEIQNSLGPIAQIATATGASIKDSADLMITAFRAYKLETSDATKIADIFINTVTNSKVTVDGLKTAFNYLASTTANLGISLEDTSSLIGVLANSGQKLSTASTGLRTTLLALTAPTKKMTDIFLKYGITVDQVNPSLHSMTDILKVLGRLSKEDLVAAFSIRSANAILALQNAGQGAIDTLRNAIDQSGVAAAVAREQLLGLSNSWKNLQQTFLSTTAVFGNSFTDSLTDLIKGFQVTLDGYRDTIKDSTEQTKISFGDIASYGTLLIGAFAGFKPVTRIIENIGLSAEKQSEAFKNWNDRIKRVSGSFTAFVGKMKDAPGVMGKLQLAGTALNTMLNTLSASLWALMSNPTFLVIAGAITAATLVLSKFIGGYLRAKQAAGEFSNSIDRQAVALGKALAAVNKSTYEYEAYVNQIKKAYAGNKDLEKSLIDLATAEFNTKKLEEINKNLVGIEDTIIPGDIRKELNGIANIDPSKVITFKDTIVSIYQNSENSTQAITALSKFKDAYIDFLKSTDDKALKSFAKSFVPEGIVDGEDEQYLKSGVERLKKPLAQINELLSKGLKPEEFQTKLKELFKSFDEDVQKALGGVLTTLGSLSIVTQQAKADVSKELKGLIGKFINLQNTIKDTSDMLSNIKFVTPTQELKVYDDLVALLKERNTLIEKYNEVKKSGDADTIKNIEKQIKELDDKRSEIMQKLSSEEVTKVSFDLAKYLTEISKTRIDLPSQDFNALNKLLAEAKQELVGVEKYFKEGIPAATKESIDNIQRMIAKEKVEIANLQIDKDGNKEAIEARQKNLSLLNNLLIYIIGTENKHINNIYKEVDAYKQLYQINSNNIRLIRGNSFHLFWS